MRKFQVTVNGNTYEVEVEEIAGNFTSKQIVTPIAAASVQETTSKVAAPVQETTSKTVVPVHQTTVAVSAQAIKVVAPMPGKIVDVKVKVGQEIKEGDLVAILEAMKMENEVFANAPGTVASVNVSAGAMVEANDVIVAIN